MCVVILSLENPGIKVANSRKSDATTCIQLSEQLDDENSSKLRRESMMAKTLFINQVSRGGVTIEND